MQIAILGPLEVRDDAGRPVEIAGARLRALLTRLALDAGRPVSVAALVDAVWGDQPPAEENNALQTLVSRLRRALGGPAAIVQSQAGYRLAATPADVDVARFEQLAAAGTDALRRGAYVAAARDLSAALRLWRGPALADSCAVSPALAPQAARLEDRRVAVLVDRLEARVQAEPEGAAASVAELEALAAEHPLNERLTALLIRALAGAGRQADALRAYEQVRATLADELGVDPSQYLQDIHVAVLRGEYGAAPPANARRTNLKAQLTSFVGREDEVARIGKSLEQNRLVTLVGPGGAGKTRLASEAAARVLDSAPDGVWLVELAPITTGADVPATVLSSLGLREMHLRERRTAVSARDAHTRLLDGLADKHVVLVLDNCEHLIEDTARLADHLLAQCPGLRVLSTSREPLGIVGEVLLAVPPLGQPAPTATAAEAFEYPAVRLFADRAAAVRPDFEIDDDAVATVIEIVRRLDGLPLAIELAAARLRTLPLEDIATRLSDRFRLLTGGSRTALPRHRTLRAVVEWSWDLLTPLERSLAEQLAVFPGGVTQDSAAAISDVELSDVPDVLASLVDKSLLQPVDGGRRMRMLETIREYGAERLAERGELAEVRARHAKYFAAVMAEAESHLLRAEQVDWLGLLGDERDNILAAMRHIGDTGDADGALRVALGLGTHAMMIGAHSELASWLAEALTYPGGADQSLRLVAEALHALNSAASGAGGNDPASGDGSGFRRDLAEYARRMSDIPTKYSPLVPLLRAVLAFFADEPDLVKQFTTEDRDDADEWTRASLLMLRANAAENDGDLEAMRVATIEAERRFRALGERWGLASTLRSLGQVRTLDGDLDGAIAAYREAMDLSAQMRVRDDEGFVLGRLADLELRRGDVAAARGHVLDARRSAEQHGEAMEAVFTAAMLGAVEHAAGNIDDARRLHHEATSRMHELPPEHPALGHIRATVLAGSTRLQAEDGDLQGAATTARDALTAARATRDLPLLASVGVTIAYLASAHGDQEDAAEILGAAARLRGADDLTSREILDLATRLRTALGDASFDAAYGRGKALGREAATERLTPRD